MYTHDTIAALATPTGSGGVAIVRISGPQAEAIARKVFRPSAPRETFVSHLLHLGHILDPVLNAPLDQGLLVIMYTPRSYTGETVVEIHCHGGVLLSRRVLEVVLSQGARLALPGEFTQRAFFNNRLDLSQAEAVLDLIQAKSDRGLQVAWQQLSGRLSEACSTLRERLISITAYVEAFLDFPEDDIPEKAQGELLEEMHVLADDMSSLQATFRQGKVFREGVRTAIVGKPNVGKSSLLNLLSGTERAIVTAVPGTTRDVLEETITVNGIPLLIWDTAGIRHTIDEVERIGVERALEGLNAAEIVIAMFDASRPLDQEDELIFLLIKEKPTVALLNKTDLPVVVHPQDLAQRLAHNSPISFSTKSATGMSELGQQIEQLALGNESPQDGKSPFSGTIVTQTRHRDALLKAGQGLRQAQANLQNGVPLDLVAVDLHAALDHIGEITGHVSSEDILDRIFRDFCIGK
ncbi:MAG: tRNA uridine-5-carboxymethylaminomethyl(34) synthesis GTPase MnmE [Deltaproteobacteria bacterium]|nr:tRNA uridine-5-carboxymethylaminomethyl(34) synthesis GTPase MnmE [Deltaproteobacteria bacterium]